MNTQPQIYRVSALAAILALLATLSLGPAASAQQSADVTVTASVDTFLSITLCDTEANFGSGLSAIGSAPTGTTDSIAATSRGLNAGEGVFYRWTPDCQAAGTGEFISVESNTTWNLRSCATESTGTNPDLKIANGDLRFAPGGFTSYEDVVQLSDAFRDCSTGTLSAGQSEGDLTFPFHYYLQVDRADAVGTFVSTTTWSVVAA